MLRRAVALAAAIGLVGLSGCGVSGTGFRPGVAADVGDERIYVDDVDDAVDGACSFLRDNEQTPQRAAGGVRSQILQSLVERAAMEQLLEERGLEPDPAYRSQLSALESQVASLPTSQRDDLYALSEASFYVQFGQLAVGADELGESAPGEELQAEGARQLADWMNHHDVEINPVFGLSADDVGTENVTVDQQGSTLEVLVYRGADETSVAQSDQARAADDSLAGAGQDDTGESASAYLDSLPSRLVC